MDTIKTSEGDLVLTFIGHASLIAQFKGMNIFVDPYGKLADYSAYPKADLIILTHDHPDHLDAAAIAKIQTASTEYALTDTCFNVLKKGIVLKNGDTKTIRGLVIEAVPAYNIKHTRAPGKPFHPKGEGNGYIITFGDKRIYIAGDTENIPEMKTFKNIYCAFLPMNLPYTMTPEMTADAARMIQPAILYPYHFGDTDTKQLLQLMKKDSGIEIRIREMK